MNVPKPARITKDQRDTSTALLQYKDRIMYVQVKEEAEITPESLDEQYQAQQELVGNERYAVLVDANNFATTSRESREYMARHQPPNRIATAIVTEQNLAARLVGNFYIRFNKPKTPTRLFERREEAVSWLKRQLEAKKPHHRKQK